MQSSLATIVTLIIVQTAESMSNQRHNFLLNVDKPEDDIDFMSSKGYLPNDKLLPQLSVMKNTKNDISYILSKLTDEELIRLLNIDPKKNVYDLNDIVRIAVGGKTTQNEKVSAPAQMKQGYIDDTLTKVNNKIYPIAYLSDTQTAYHKLNHKEILPQKQKNSASFLALKKLNSLIHNRSQKDLEEEKLSDEKKELLFDILVAQLKTLCCKSTAKKRIPQFNDVHNENIAEKMETQPQNKPQAYIRDVKNNEYIFLVLNDEIKNMDNDDLVLVDPDTLEKNSSVLILGPVTSPLTDNQLKIVMNRISNELSKPEYTSLIQQLSDGTISDSNISVMKNFISGPETRRYIKAHRCNHQSKLAKIYGGPKWLICTGYLNINTPSLYD
ncbi:uncharacterized protein LOC124541033 [Vanessa cardui]|uniref:uncharacterized protein LOC124541033 n=1 Tax=Vanessa cardui TaxID=171605 RepID=UPI001F12BFE2|nr:uncharacterized protein LOC124541033 [Vanessa cardui]